MGYIIGENRHQATLFPETLDEYISESNPARVIDAFVDQINLIEAGFLNAIPAKEGRPSYRPDCLLKLYISETLKKRKDKARRYSEVLRSRL